MCIFHSYKCILSCSILRIESGEIIMCEVKRQIESAGVMCEIVGGVVYVSRDHGMVVGKDGDRIQVRVIGVKYELNDPHVSIIGISIGNTLTQSHTIPHNQSHK